MGLTATFGDMFDEAKNWPEIQVILGGVQPTRAPRSGVELSASYIVPVPHAGSNQLDRWGIALNALRSGMRTIQVTPEDVRTEIRLGPGYLIMPVTARGNVHPDADTPAAGMERLLRSARQTLGEDSNAPVTVSSTVDVREVGWCIGEAERFAYAEGFQIPVPRNRLAANMWKQLLTIRLDLVLLREEIVRTADRLVRHDLFNWKGYTKATGLTLPRFVADHSFTADEVRASAFCTGQDQRDYLRPLFRRKYGNELEKLEEQWEFVNRQGDPPTVAAHATEILVTYMALTQVLGTSIYTMVSREEELDTEVQVRLPPDKS